MTVARVVDGDTVDLSDGQTVRLVQIDAPEPREGECYSRRAAQVLRRLLPDGTEVPLEADPQLDDVDQYGRLLLYIHVGDMNVNLELVTEGAASAWFYQGQHGKYADQLLAAAESAQATAVGLWKACRGTVLDPLHAINATSELPEATVEEQPKPDQPEPEQAEPETGGCDSSYPDFCVRPPPPDLDCDEVGGSYFTVRPPDPHRFDGNGDGVGCESGEQRRDGVNESTMSSMWSGFQPRFSPGSPDGAAGGS